MFRVFGWITLALTSTSPTLAQFKLPTVDEALQLSATTGKPIFAMAGQET